MTDRALLQQALEALEFHVKNADEIEEIDLALVTALRERLAQPEQEPVFDCPRCGHCCPQRKPLTDEVIWLEYQRFWPFHPAEEPTLAKDIAKFARAIEAAHGIKGEA